MRVKLASVVLVLGLSLSGCVGGASGSDESTPTAGNDPLRPDQVDPDSDFGVVQGSVLNEETLPIEGAEVALKDTEFRGVTDARGLFLMRDVPPGKYVLLVGALGYEAQAKTVEVQRAQITEMHLLLRAVETSTEAFYVVFHFAGWYDCALATQVWISACSYPYTAVWGTAKEHGVNLSQYGAPADIQKNVFRFNFTIKQNVTEVIGEMAWTAASAAATRMSLMFLCGDYDYVWDDCLYPPSTGDSIRYGAQARGTSPLRKEVEAKEFIDKGKGKGKWDLEKNPQIWVMNYCGLPFSGFNPPEAPEVAFQQKFEVWDSVFYNGPAPDNFTLLGDH